MSCRSCGDKAALVFLLQPVCSVNCQKKLWDGFMPNVRKCLVSIGNLNSKTSHVYQLLLQDFPEVAGKIVNAEGEIDDALVEAQFRALFPEHMHILMPDDTRRNIFNLRQLLRSETGDEKLHVEKVKVHQDLNAEYEEIEELGRGQYGKVIKARNRKRVEPFCALKLMDMETMRMGRTRKVAAEREYAVMRFMSEEFAVSKPHPNIVGFEQAFAARVKGVMHMVLKYEYVDGDTLRIFTEIERLAGTAILDVGVAVFSALAFLHGNGLVHRDIKPDNIMFNRNTNTITVIDLGFACFFDGRGPISCFDGPIKGSYSFLSPEVLRREILNQTPSAEDLILADIWAVGVILFELITLKTPPWFSAKTTEQMKQKLVGRGQEALYDCVRLLMPYAVLNGEYEWLGIQTMDILNLDTRPNAAEMQARFAGERYKPAVITFKPADEQAPSERGGDTGQDSSSSGGAGSTSSTTHSSDGNNRGPAAETVRGHALHPWGDPQSSARKEGWRP